MLVTNNNNYSAIFSTTVGVRQGGVLSPKLFSIYVEDIIPRIESVKMGIKIGNLSLDVMLYADDIIIVSNSKEGMQKQLEVVTNFGLENYIKYNPDKTVFMVFNHCISKQAKDRILDNVNEPITLDGVEIKRVDQMRYLGDEINLRLDHKDHCKRRKSLTMGSLMRLKTIGIVTNQMHPYTKAQLYKTYIRPVLLNGFENQIITRTLLNDLKRYEGNIVKRLMNVPTRCRTTCLFLSLNIIPSDLNLMNIKVDFYTRLVKNEFIRTLMIEISKLTIENDFIGEVLDLTEDINETGLTLIDKCKLLRSRNSNQIKQGCTDEKVKKLKEIFNTVKDKDKIPNLIFEICRYDLI